MATVFTITNPFIGHGIVLVEGEDEAVVAKAAAVASFALSAVTEPHSAPANFGYPNGLPDGPVLSDEGGVKFTLFSTTTDEEVAALKNMSVAAYDAEQKRLADEAASQDAQERAEYEAWKKVMAAKPVAGKK